MKIFDIRFMRKILLLFTALIAISSCSFDTPENYFDRTTLNTNKLRDFGSARLKRMIAEKDGDMLFTIKNEELEKTSSVEEHILNFLLPDIEKDIKKVKDLKPIEDTEAMIEASLEVYDFAKKKYETDYIEIAKLIDRQAPKAEIAALMEQFDDENVPKLESLHEKLMIIAMAYAEDNGIEVKRY
ncbi:MAG: hypothetical protein Mars2KO_30930 [Maribacter sp.]